MKPVLKKTVSIFSGDIIERYRLERYIGFVFYLFVLGCVIIAWSIWVEEKLVRVEDNQNTIKELRIKSEEMDINLLKIDRRSTLENLLLKNKSTLEAPVEPATIIEGGSK